MPLDLNCPKCQHVFPVTEARHPVGVECPGCAVDLTAEFRKRTTAEAGQHPYELLVSVGRPPGSQPVPAGGKKLRLDDEGEETARGNGSMAVVIFAGIGALLIALGGLGAAGYALFTNLDTSDSTLASASSNTKSGTNPKGGFNSKGGGLNQKGGFNPGIPDTPPFEPQQKQKTDAFELQPVSGTTQQISPPPIDLSLPVTRTLPGRADAVTVGGNGRYIIFYIASTQQLTVFDANKGDFTATQRVPDGGPLSLAGGQNRVVTCSFGNRMLRSYSLPDLRTEFDFQNPLFHPASAVAMGSATNSPVLLSDPFGNVALMELTSTGAKLVEGSKTQEQLNVASQPVTVHAAPNGKLFVFSHGDNQNEKAGILTEQGRKWKLVTIEISVPTISPDARYLFGFGQISDMSGRQIGTRVGGPGNSIWYLAGASHASGASDRYFLRVAEMKQNGKEVLSISVHTNPLSVEKDKKPISIGVLPEAEGLLDWHRENALALYQNFYLIPDAKLLVVMPVTRDKIVLRKLELK